MKENKLGLLVIALLLLCLITISVMSIEKVENVVDEAMTIAESTFHETPTEPNQEVENFTIYIPDELKIDEQSKNNAVLVSNDGQSYILFINDIENKQSKLNYETVREHSNGESDWLETFEDEDRFGYVYIQPLEDDFEVQIGIGGIKLTTISSKQNIVDDVEMMMDISNSIDYQIVEEG